MPSVLINAERPEDESDLVHRAVEALVAGNLVAFPTETVYGVAALASHATAVERLCRLKNRQPGHPLALAVKGYEETLDYCPDLSPVARRIAQRCWPGPVTLVLECSHPDSLKARLPETVQAAVAPHGTIGFRVANHRFVQSALHLLPGPLALTSANRPGEPEAIHADEVAGELGSEIDIILGDGRCKYGQASSVVQVSGDQLKLLREGVVSETSVRRFASLMVLLVCTGNTCRSPMAQVLLQQRFADRLGCRPEELEDRGVMVLSCGLAAFQGSPASPEAVDVLQQRGLDLSQHESRGLNEALVHFSDLVLTMTQGHREAIVAQWPQAGHKVALLAPDGQDISDPIGGTLEAYQACADQIDAHLAQWLDAPVLRHIPVF